ncbi:GNAT family N-acetyltransferase [Bacillus sp. FJAT-22090]|uniref:GNAT family N-acetyltransferase n=1 Tax=Bacillus sp. FJAT-22090 TaxID=1581038 RepID=UPI0011A66BDC|nr:GNAT family N-acetyltransferase [Bacillus sp. FJAT-22090]
MEITKFKKTDIQEIIHLFYDTVHTVNTKDYSKDQLDAWAPLNDIQWKRKAWSKSLSENITYVAKINNTIVGFCDITIDGLLDRLYVHKDFQRKGIASDLLYKLESEARNLKLQEIQTYASITAKVFFENHDFTSISINYVERNGTILTNFLMKKRL